MKNKIKYFFKRFIFLKALNSPFKSFKLKWYIGKVAIGTPYFYPRVWKENKDKPDYLIPVPKKIGFDFVGLGYKTKWTSKDYRFEYAPLISFVFFKWQIALMFIAPESSHYWSSWLYYENNTNKSKSKRERIKQCQDEFPQNWTQYKNGNKESINYYKFILKEKYYENKVR